MFVLTLSFQDLATLLLVAVVGGFLSPLFLLLLLGIWQSPSA
jgi:hypothetical protein